MLQPITKLYCKIHKKIKLNHWFLRYECSLSGKQEKVFVFYCKKCKNAFRVIEN